MSKQAAGGGLIRNSTDTCSLAYTMNMGSCSITKAELRVVTTGHEMA
ncbi:hypothetical protein LINPERHAP1_LOCUS7765 [Linum perenne]